MADQGRAQCTADVEERARELEQKLRMIMSHATGGVSCNINQSTNDICVAISANRNLIYQAGKDAALRTVERHEVDVEGLKDRLTNFTTCGCGDDDWPQLRRDTMDVIDALRTADAQGKPIDMILHCPTCHMQHVDEATDEWENPPHRSHLCQACGCIWRPADVPTNGVAQIKTRGQADTETDAQGGVDRVELEKIIGTSMFRMSVPEKADAILAFLAGGKK